MKFDHIGVVVNNLPEGRRLLSAMQGVDHWTEAIADHEIGVYVQFGIGPNGPCYELIAPLTRASPVSGALKGSKNVLNHVGYLVANLDEAETHLRALGCFPTRDPQPAVAYGGKRIQFFLSPLRFMIELIEAPKHQHLFASGER
jgi:methylmalonyl-CoA/ethylmalonyl-CoA epimerase